MAALQAVRACIEEYGVAGNFPYSCRHADAAAAASFNPPLDVHCGEVHAVLKCAFDFSRKLALLSTVKLCVGK